MKGLIKLIQGTTNNLVWFFNLSLFAAILGAIGISVWYTEYEGGWNFIKEIRKKEIEDQEDDYFEEVKKEVKKKRI